MTLQLHLPPDYVLDKMELFEIRAILKYQYYAHKDEWEQSRLVAYIVAQANSTKKLKIQDIIKFGWEEEVEKEIISKEQIDGLKERAAQMEALLNKNTITNTNNG